MPHGLNFSGGCIPYSGWKVFISDDLRRYGFAKVLQGKDLVTESLFSGTYRVECLYLLAEYTLQATCSCSFFLPAARQTTPTIVRGVGYIICKVDGSFLRLE
jgi:hypothetical protein